MSLGPSLQVASSPSQVSEALASQALHPIVGTFYRTSFLLREEWSRSFHPAARGRLAWIFPQASFLIHYKETMHFQDMSPPHFVWSSYVDF